MDQVPGVTSFPLAVRTLPCGGHLDDERLGGEQRSNGSGITCASNMPCAGREVQAERLGARELFEASGSFPG